MAKQASNIQTSKYYVVRHDDLPASCPCSGSVQWDLHPKVYFNLEPNVRTACPYCGAVYMLVEQ